jgi:ubiquitin-protein ligase E3 D
MHNKLPVMSLSSPALIYAELLSNIGQVTIIVSVEKPFTSDTKAELSEDRKLLRLFHDGRTATLILPARVAADAKLQKPALDCKEMVWRLPLAHQVPANGGADFADSTSAPWQATKLSAETQINCQKCLSIIVRSQTVKTWKDLPSENWAEMMDFWHCHKPHDHHDNANGHSDVENKGYGANAKFMAQSGVGFINLTYFLLSEKDCTGVKVGDYLQFFHKLRSSLRVSRRRPGLHEVLSVARLPIQVPNIKVLCTTAQQKP